MKLFTFYLGSKRCGIEAEYVYRVLDDLTVAPVALTPPCYRGLLFYRGEMYDVADLSQLLVGEPAALDARTRYILLKWGGRKLAVITGAIRGLIWTEGPEESLHVSTAEGDRVRVLDPGELWKRLLGQDYGSLQV